MKDDGVRGADPATDGSLHDAILDVRHPGRVDDAHALQPQGRPDSLEQARPSAEDERHDVQLQFVDEAGAQVLVDRVRTCASADSIPSVTNVNVVSERVSGSRA